MALPGPWCRQNFACILDEPSALVNLKRVCLLRSSSVSRRL